jgi:hypothetical protein
MIGWFIALAAAVMAFDLYFRYSPDTALLMLTGFLIPVTYLAVMLLAPLFTNLSEDKPVPQERRALSKRYA